MRFERTDSFRADYRRLKEGERKMFSQAVLEMNRAFAGRGDRPFPIWPARLRVKSVKAADGIWEMTWSFSGPDGRATFEYVTLDGEPAIRWRRIGDHAVFAKP
jgi:hypothetical protein